MGYEEDIKQAIETLKAGGVILYPTDTVWGLGCDATNEEAVKKVYHIKQRANANSLIVLVDNEAMLNKYVDQLPEITWDLIDNYEKALTIIYPGARALAKNVINQNGSIGIRITKDEFCKKMIHKFNKPIVSTSANISGEKTPGGFEEISPDIKGGVDYIVKHRQKEFNISPPSTVIRIEMSGEFEIIRA